MFHVSEMKDRHSSKSYIKKQEDKLKKMSDNLRGILLVELKIEEADFVLINICNMNVQPEQLQILSDLHSILD